MIHNALNNLKSFLERDSDITFKDEMHYIRICFSETIKILLYNIKKKL